MAGIKRKETPRSMKNTFSNNKKTKIEPKAPKKSRLSSKFAETETDSDPIVESDTTENSGDDDGVSWPSDNEDDEKDHDVAQEDYFEDFDEDDDGGGVKVGTEKGKPLALRPAANTAKPCTFFETNSFILCA